MHCAAGKDRTGTIVALALSVAGADRDAIIADYAASTERIEAIVERLLRSRDVRREPARSADVVPRDPPETMQASWTTSTSEYGGAEPLLGRMGWTDDDSERLRAKLRG